MSDEFDRAFSLQVKHHCQQAAQHHASEAFDALSAAAIYADTYDFRGAGEEMRAATIELLKAAAWSALAGMVRG